jgi:hypothetical protein
VHSASSLHFPSGSHHHDGHHGDWHHDGHHDGHHHHHSDFFFGFGFGFGFGYGYAAFGYPYYGYYYPYYPYYYRPYYAYPYYSYPYYPYYPSYCAPVYVSYPYVGYYSTYDYPYLDDYGYTSCAFYNGYYVRFGPYRTSYYATCSGLGVHAYGSHHVHQQYCSVHGYHYYHVRDCSLCYPGGGAVAPDPELSSATDSYVETPVTPSPDAAEAAPAAESERELAPRTIRPIPGPAGAAATQERRPLVGEEAFFASLKPAQLSFAFGFMHFKNRNYDEAAESFYNASLEDPDSRLVKVFLGLSLYSIGEYRYAAEYLRHGLESWPEFASLGLDLQGFYGSEEDREAHLKLLRSEVELRPLDEDPLLVLAFVEFGSGQAAAAGPSLDVLGGFASDPATRTVAGEYAAASEGRPEPALGPEDAAVAAFFAQPDIKAVPNLPIQ